MYGVHRTCAETAAVSCGTSHASAVSTPFRWIFKKTRYRKLFTHGKRDYIKVINNNNKYTRHNSGMRRPKKKTKKITSPLHPPQNTACSLWDQRCSLPALRKKTSVLRLLSLKTLKPFCSCIPADNTISWLRPPFPDPVRVTVVSPPATKHIGFLLLYALAALMAICVTNTVAIYTSKKRSGLSLSRCLHS